MKKTNIGVAIIVFILMVGLVAALIGGLGFSLSQARRLFGGLEPLTAIVLGAACLTALLAAWLVASAIRGSREREVAASAAAERGRIYAGLLEALAPNSRPTPPTWPAIREALFLRGSNGVLHEYQATLQLLSATATPEEQARQQLTRLMLAMRRDVGGSTFGLENQDWSDWLAHRPATASANDAARPSPPSNLSEDWLPPVHRLAPDA